MQAAFDIGFGIIVVGGYFTHAACLLAVGWYARGENDKAKRRELRKRREARRWTRTFRPTNRISGYLSSEN